MQFLDTAKQAVCMVFGTIQLDLPLENTVEPEPIVKVNDKEVKVKKTVSGVWEYSAVVPYRDVTAKVEVWLDLAYKHVEVPLRIGQPKMQNFEFGDSE